MGMKWFLRIWVKVGPSGMVARVSFLADRSDYALLQQHDGSKCNSLLIKVKR
jgi:hypothetical protein